jgi:hypothetical protein
MGDFSTIIQNAIEDVAGREGLERFQKAWNGEEAKSIVGPDGSLDLQALMGTLSSVFPDERASEIADRVLAGYAGMRPVEGDGKARDDAYADSLARYLDTDAGDMRGLLDEARRIRVAMGKASRAAEPIAHATHAPEPREEDPGEITLDEEVRKFVHSKKAPTSLDIMDFIRYLRDKGHPFQEKAILEKVYAEIEELKSLERAELVADIQAFLKGAPWPGEDEVSAYIERKKGEGVLCESAEIRRMVLAEMMRRY